jgi:hypothetical protein
MLFLSALGLAALALTFGSWFIGSLAICCFVFAVIDHELTARIRRDDEEFENRRRNR